MIKDNEKLICDEMSVKIIDTVRDIIVSEGIHQLNVRKVLQKMEITNRVFYNRFHNIDEVLDILSEESVYKVRQSIISSFDKNRDYFEQIREIIDKTLIYSYDTRANFAHYVFENDSKSSSNYDWWMSEIKKILKYGVDKGYIKNIDLDMTGYAIWCFIRGFNTDAVARNLPLEEAIKTYRYGFDFILKGIKA